MELTSTSASGRKGMGPHSLGPQSGGYVSICFSWRLKQNGAASDRLPSVNPGTPQPSQTPLSQDDACGTDRRTCRQAGRAGQGRAGQGRAGQGRAGQGRAGQGRAPEAEHGKPELRIDASVSSSLAGDVPVGLKY
ncbi:MAG: hypothetical protein FRX49_01825 [Trebouxia sp. A1-2]|nr:MAG: hypothetical protein FRX49_01825 [Trebouxia sp. A1-2]